MKKIKYISVLAVSTILSVGLFQNCSKITPQDLAQTKVSNTGNAVDNSQAAVITSPDSTATPPPRQLTALPSEPLLTSTPAILEHSDANETKHDSGETQASHPTEEKPPQRIVPTEEAQAIAQCLNGRGRSIHNGTSLIGLRGSVEIDADDINQIEDNRGKLIIRSLPSRRGHINHMIDNAGAILICGMDIDLISDIAGNLTLVNSSVKDLRHVRGTIKSYNTTIEATDGKIKSLQN